MILLGVVIGYFIAKFTSPEPKAPNVNIDSSYVQKSLYESLQRENREKGQEISNLSGHLSTYKEKSLNLERRLGEHKDEFDEIKNKLALEFKVLSNKIFEEKSEKFLSLNQKNVSDILNPLKDKIKEFENKFESNHNSATSQNATLGAQLKSITDLNTKLSADATKLTNALKGDKKLQGTWGEIQLEMILIKVGLTKGIHFTSQTTLKSEDNKNLRPDYIIKLPDNKNLILDSKVSLVAYEQYFNEENDILKQKHLKEHVKNINTHILDLGSKNYQNLYNISTLDYIIMFVPLEPALFAALQEDSKIFENALEKNIVLVSTSTLLATLRTISYIWKQDRLSKSHLEIARESGLLYDKFVGFTEDLLNLGKKLEGANSDYHNAINKLKNSPQKGNTIFGRMANIKELGAIATKSIPPNLLSDLEDESFIEENSKNESRKKSTAPDNLFNMDSNE